MEAVNLTVWNWSSCDSMILEASSLLATSTSSSCSCEGTLNLNNYGAAGPDHDNIHSIHKFSIIQLLWGAVLFSVANLVFQTLNWNLASRRLPPCPSVLEVLYHFFLQVVIFRRRPQEDFFTRLGRNYFGGVIRLNWFLTGLTHGLSSNILCLARSSNQWPAAVILISSAAAAQEFFKLHDAQFGARPSQMPMAMWGPGAAYWRHLQLILDVTRPRGDRSLPELCTSAADSSSAAKQLGFLDQWALAAIREHPEAVARLQSELERVVGSDRLQVEESDIAKLPYLQAVVKELFRLHPPAPFSLPHELVASAAIADVNQEQYHEQQQQQQLEFFNHAAAAAAEENYYYYYSCEQQLLQGHDIQAAGPGTQVFINIYAVNRDPSVWDHAHEFRPDRFFLENSELDLVPAGKLHTNNNNNNNFVFLPFGAGRRQCPGARLAVLFVQLGLANQLHTCRINHSLRTK